MSPAFRPAPPGGYEAKAAELPAMRERFRDNVAEQLAAIGKTIAYQFEVEYMMKINYKIRPAEAPKIGIKSRVGHNEKEQAAPTEKFTAVMFYKRSTPPVDEPFLEIRAAFTDESAQPDAKKHSSFVDRIQVTLREPGREPRELLSLKFVCYEGTFGRRPLPWQLGFMAEDYRLRTQAPPGQRGLNLPADDRQGYAAGAATDGILADIEALLSEQDISRRPEPQRSPSKKNARRRARPKRRSNSRIKNQENGKFLILLYISKSHKISYVK
jgi:hypothetical protein